MPHTRPDEIVGRLRSEVGSDLHFVSVVYGKPMQYDAIYTSSTAREEIEKLTCKERAKIHRHLCLKVESMRVLNTVKGTPRKVRWIDDICDKYPTYCLPLSDGRGLYVALEEDADEMSHNAAIEVMDWVAEEVGHRPVTDDNLDMKEELRCLDSCSD